MSAASATAVVRFGRLESRGILLGLNLTQVILVGIGLSVLVVAQFVGGASAALVTAPIWVVLLALGTVSVGGRTALDWITVASYWVVRTLTQGRSHGASLDRSVSVVVPGLPGVEIVESPAGHAVVVDHTEGSATLVISLAGNGFLLLGDGEQQQRVDAWATVLSTLCRRPEVVRAQVLVRSRPDAGAGMHAWWRDHMVAPGSWVARLVAELVDDSAASSATQETSLAVAFRLPRTRGRTRQQSASASAAEQWAHVTVEALIGAGLRDVRPLSPGELSVALRKAYDPLSPGGTLGVSLSLDALPCAGNDEQWDRLDTDSASHAVYWIREWPLTDASVAFLQPLLLGGAHRALSLTCEPVASREALRDIRRAKVEQRANADQRSRIGRVEDEAHHAEADDVARREIDLVAGHGELRFTGLVTVSAPPSDLDAACAAMETAAAQSLCEVRRLVGQQSSAFVAAALPLARRTS